MTQDVYTLQVGAAGAKRLAMLNRLHNPYTLRGLSQCHLGPDSCVLDLGCGMGILTHDIAQRCGGVVGVDISAEQLELARECAESNTEFFQLAAQDLSSLDRKFDVIVCRYLLAHLGDPDAVVEQMLLKLKPGGRILSEETTGADSLACYPSSASYAAWGEVMRQQARINGADLEIGLKLPTKLRALGCELEAASMYQVMLTTPEEKQLARLGVEEVASLFVERGIWDESRIQSLCRELEELEHDHLYVAAYARVSQVIVRRD